MGTARTRERRKEREQERRRQRTTLLIVGGVVVAAVLLALVLVTQLPAEAPIPEYSVARYEGIEQSTTEQGFFVLGSANAPVEVVEYSSFDCTACADFHNQAVPGLLDRVRAGEIRFRYVPVFGTGGILNGEGAARAAVCAGQQGKFWEYHDALFSWQGLFANAAFSQSRLIGGVTGLGLDRGAWDACMASPLPGTVTAAAVAAGRTQNIPGTPAIYVNGSIVQPASVEGINTAIDAALAVAPAVVPQPTAAPVEPTTAPAEPTTAPAEPTTAPAEPTSEPTVTPSS